MGHPPYILAEALTPDERDWLDGICDEPEFFEGLENAYGVAYEADHATPDFPARGQLRAKAAEIHRTTEDLRQKLNDRFSASLISYVLGEARASELSSTLEDLSTLQELSDQLAGRGGHGNAAAHVLAYLTLQTFDCCGVAAKGDDRSDFVRVVTLLMLKLSIDANARHTANKVLKGSEEPPRQKLMNSLRTRVGPTNAAAAFWRRVVRHSNPQG